MRLPAHWRRIVHDGVVVCSVVIIGFVWWLVTANDYQHDAMAYWAAGLDDPYRDSVVGRRSTFLYSPAFAQVVWPLSWVPWDVVRGIWAALNLGGLVWLVGPIIGAILLVIPGSPVIDEVSTGNIHLLLAVAIVAAVRWPGAWAFPLLTKVTPGVGLGYLLGARRWRELGIALGVTAAISLVSFALAPHLWLQWIDVLAESAGVRIPSDIGVIPGPLILRTAIAGAIAVVGGVLGWPWMIPVAATIALPVPWSSGLSVLLGVVALWRRDLVVERAAQKVPQGSSSVADASS